MALEEVCYQKMRSPAWNLCSSVEAIEAIEAKPAREVELTTLCWRMR